MDKWNQKAKLLIKSDPSLTQEIVAEKLGVTQGALGHWLNGRREPSIQIIRDIAKILNTEFVHLIDPSTVNIHNTIHHNKATIDKELMAWNNVKNVPEPIFRKDIPVISTVKAGGFKEVIDIYQPGYADDWVQSEVKCSDSTFALLIEGDSMEPRFFHGDRVIIDPEVSPEIGDFVVARHNGDNEATFKKYVKDGSKHVLIPLNQMYDKIELGEDTEIIGVAISRLPPVERLK